MSSKGDSEASAAAALPSRDFSDPLARALDGGPPLRLDGKGGVSFDIAAASGSSGVGSRVKWGLFKEAIPEEEVDGSPEAERAREALREAAARDLVNIDEAERERRGLAGAAFAAGAALLAGALLWTQAAWYLRLGIFPVVALAYGFLLSAEEGL